jgi:Raf kinase inhibitor-like YbhB/YbcL family protein
MTSPSWTPAGEIPAEYTCDGSGISPPLTWVNVPDGTAELVLVVTDPDADGFIHWMVANIDPTTTGIQAGEVPPGSVPLTSTDGRAAYAPLCPPSGPSHTYEFALYALSSPSGLTPEADTQAAVAQVASNTAATAVVTGTYARTTAN